MIIHGNKVKTIVIDGVNYPLVEDRQVKIKRGAQLMKMQKMYETKRFILTPFTRDIAASSNYKEWFYDKDVTRYNHWGLFHHSKQKEDAFLYMCESGEGDVVLAILVPDEYKDYKHIGNVSLQSINNIYRSAEFAITIGEKEYWGQRYGYEALLLLFHHGFDKLNLHRIWTGTAITNEGMKKIIHKLGMLHEGTFKQAMYLDGIYEDIVAYGMLKNEWVSSKKRLEVNRLLGA